MYVAPLTGVVIATVGSVLSILIPLTVAVDELPAKSWQVPLTDCPTPSAETVVGAGGLAAPSPESVSAHWKLTVTTELFHPLGFGAGAREPTMLGGVLSICTARVLAVSTLPALSVLE